VQRSKGGTGEVVLVLETLTGTETVADEILGATVTTVVDNTTAQSGLHNVWGLSLHVEIELPGRTEAILFDTSGSAQVFRHNAMTLNMDFSNLRAIVISHFHHDHFGAIEPALELVGPSDLTVYLPSHHDTLEMTLSKVGVRRIIGDSSQLIHPSISTTGALGPKKLKEHGLVLNVANYDLVLLAGCAHPGLTRLIKAAKKTYLNRHLHAVIGGFHLKTTEDGLIAGELFTKEKVNIISPCHCTHAKAKAAIREVVGDVVYHENGSGTQITIR
jgi:7,8-dihydropterin-6-yl-methyl-4-(beta-D-ribofuranosyl)aminobenzene 5'-phosphate synthase